jgi:hypothetical protein
LVDGLDGDVVDDPDAVAAQLLAEQLAELGSTVGMTAGACSTRVTERPRLVKASAISRPM